MNMNAKSSQENQPIKFYILVFILAIPFWIFGGKALPVAVKLPISAFAAFMPMVAAVILTFTQTGFSGINELFKRVLDYKKITNKRWYLPILLLSPVIYVLSYVLMRLTGMPLPDPISIPFGMVPVYIVVFFLFGIGEELGWMGYAVDPLQNRWGALKASIFMGLLWGLFHLIPDLQNQQAAAWIFWHRLGTIVLRIIIVWIYNNTDKSVFGAIMFHVMNNLSWALFPNNGSHYDPLSITLIFCLVGGIAIFGWGSKTLAHYRFASAGRMKIIETGKS